MGAVTAKMEEANTQLPEYSLRARRFNHFIVLVLGC